MSKKKIIAIVGLMGAGKTTVGTRLAQILKYYFIDSDQEIEDGEHRSIADIFAQNGEKYFREIEGKTIREIINRDEEMVLSLGGGAFVNPETRKILKQKTLIIWLHASIEETLKRVSSKANRPLLNQKNKLTKTANSNVTFGIASISKIPAINFKNNESTKSPRR